MSPSFWFGSTSENEWNDEIVLWIWIKYETALITVMKMTYWNIKVEILKNATIINIHLGAISQVFIVNFNRRLRDFLKNPCVCRTDGAVRTVVIFALTCSALYYNLKPKRPWEKQAKYCVMPRKKMERNVILAVMICHLPEIQLTDWSSSCKKGQIKARLFCFRIRKTEFAKSSRIIFPSPVSSPLGNSSTNSHECHSTLALLLLLL